MEMVGLAKKISLMADREVSHLGDLIGRNLEPQQIQLFIESSPQERNSLAEGWRSDLASALKNHATHAPTAAQTATTSLVVGGAIGCLAFTTMTLMTHDASFFEAGKSLLGAITSPSTGFSSQGWDWPNADQIVEQGATASMGATLTLLLIKSSATMLSELLKPDPQRALSLARRDLEDRTMGVFFRLEGQEFSTPGGGVDQASAMRVLQDMPDAYLPILTHFQPKELVMFLVSDDEARESMLRVNAPSMDQRIDVVRGLHANKMRRAWETARQSLSAWEGVFSNKSTVSLSSSLSALRAGRNERLSPNQQDRAMAPRTSGL